MISKSLRPRTFAQIAAIESLLQAIPLTNFASRIGLEEQLEGLKNELAETESITKKLANVALYFGGQPVNGSRAIEADFAANALSTYQDVVTTVWKESLREKKIDLKRVSKEASRLHITDVVHGSFGFVLEEIDENGTPLFKSALKESLDRAIELISGIADQDDDVFNDVMAVMPSKVFSAVRNFYRVVRNGKATFRMVEEQLDYTFDATAIERAYDRAEYTTAQEEEFEIEGELLGIIPIGRRFEFKRKDDGSVISGKVGLVFSQEYLERISKEQLTGRPCHAVFQKKEIKKLRKTRDVWVLTKLSGV